MPLYLKRLKKSGRETYLYYPDIPNRSAFKRTAITILRETPDEESVRTLLAGGLKKLAAEQELILSFPNPTPEGWNYHLDPAKADDITAFCDLQNGMDKPNDDPIPVNELGIPTLEAMLSTWHPMNDTKYLIGIGTGASMAYTLAACQPDNIAAVLAIGGSLCKEATEKAVYAPIPMSMVSADAETLTYFVKANEVTLTDSGETRDLYTSAVNPHLHVVADKTSTAFSEKLLLKVWERSFSKVRRTNTGAHGDCALRMDIHKAGFEFYLDDPSLDGREHTWFVHVPACVRKNSAKKVPLMVFFHGGSDNPAEAAEMSKFHELGEKEGFITVYPWGSNNAGWNSGMLPEEEDDVFFATALLHFMVEKYPVDPERLYLSGFSNGAGMAQTVAMLHPEKIAAICHIDSNWPGQRFGAMEVDYHDITPMALGMKRKETYDYRMPVWYTYGTREPSYPVYQGCSQQHQYDYWKMYNNIEVKSTPPLETPDPTGCGVKGDVSETLYPSKTYPHHFYSVQRFFTKDEVPENYYNYVVMHDKGHEVAEMDPALGWAYVKQFKRNPDGSVGRVEE